MRPYNSFLSIKIPFKLQLSQTVGMVAWLDWPVPDVSTLCGTQKILAVQITCHRADRPLNLLVDSPVLLAKTIISEFSQS